MRLSALIATGLIFAVSMQASDGVILLHGLCRTSRSMEKMETAISAAGYVVVNIDYPSRTAPIHTLSDAAIDRAMVDPRLRECSRIHFVTHSLGGILVRSYFGRHGTERLGRVVMLGPPNQGSEVVDKLGSWRLFQKINGPAGLELGTGAESVPNRLGPVQFETGVIAGNHSINWINSLFIRGPDDGKVSVTRTKVEGMKALLVVPTAHPFLPQNEKVIQSTIHFLQSGDFALSATDSHLR